MLRLGVICGQNVGSVLDVLTAIARKSIRHHVCSICKKMNNPS